jgi:hypothetical protein
MLKHLATTIEKEQYYCKELSNEMMKINVITSEINQTAETRKNSSSYIPDQRRMGL